MLTFVTTRTLFLLLIRSNNLTTNVFGEVLATVVENDVQIK